MGWCQHNGCTRTAGGVNKPASTRSEILSSYVAGMFEFSFFISSVLSVLSSPDRQLAGPVYVHIHELSSSPKSLVVHTVLVTHL